MDDYNWKLKVVQRCPLFITELGREEMVEWVQEQTDSDVGVLQVEYTRCDALDRPFVSGTVGASIWEIVDEGDGDAYWRLVKGIPHFLHIGLAKRWLAAQQEIYDVLEINEEMRFGTDFEDDENDWFFDS